ncbi:hypothetical protein BAUCODRAFT_21327 [Baudoinia panamericana UAMH 10762]|uniref:C2H2-type domain-containing protein n=1 Tax=Baudoinia panamericana (strain UAMH 10762) TaxID=717646 RepID=M2NJH7_BAUPA|nr:uncharacterized protein BAUCODRAFT_21327 [Baudoinia panamericana UAMH 10762]EMC99544.1 hypothetical protein BAUCODRAFT_21327 [Baudoinia panamericana UAMH 10762]
MSIITAVLTIVTLLLGIASSAVRLWQHCKRTTPVSVNYHFTRKTSYVAPEADVKRGLELLKDAGMRMMNFAGGEPFMYHKKLAMLVKYCKVDLNLESVSIISNGSKVTKQWLDENGNCDSFDEKTNINIGRGKGEHIRQLFRIRDWCRESSFKFKLNTVVCTLNWQDDMVEIVNELDPFRWKCFQVLFVEDENDASESASPPHPSAERALKHRRDAPHRVTADNSIDDRPIIGDDPSEYHLHTAQHQRNVNEQHTTDYHSGIGVDHSADGDRSLAYGGPATGPLPEFIVPRSDGYCWILPCKEVFKIGDIMTQARHEMAVHGRMLFEASHAGIVVCDDCQAGFSCMTFYNLYYCALSRIIKQLLTTYTVTKRGGTATQLSYKQFNIRYYESAYHQNDLAFDPSLFDAVWEQIACSTNSRGPDATPMLFMNQDIHVCNAAPCHQTFDFSRALKQHHKAHTLGVIESKINSGPWQFDFPSLRRALKPATGPEDTDLSFGPWRRSVLGAT